MAAKKVIKKKVVAKPAKKVAAKTATKTAVKAVAKVAAPKKLPAIKAKYTKSAILAEISTNTELSKKQVTAVFNELNDLIARHVKKGAAGEFTLPGLLKIKTVKKPARKARKGVPNPFRPGEVMNIASKPASTKVKILPLKGLKELV
jgi:nucleoid DNA-binding protein